MSYDTIITKRDGAIGIITLNRPKALNALSTKLMAELADALAEYDRDDAVRAIVIAGSDRVFAAGADISEMAETGPIELMRGNRFNKWDGVRDIATPIIAAVSGHCLGGGCELVMCCDIIVASETARFAQPEINLGIIPGAGGTQRLTRAVGKAAAMDIILTGRAIKAAEALAMGLISRVASQDAWLDEALKVARTIASKSPIASRLAKASVQAAFDTPLQAGIEIERANFYLTFASEDRKEGMNAFLEKREPTFTGR